MPDSIKRPRILMIPVEIGKHLADHREWSDLRLFADLDSFNINNEAYLLDGEKKGVSLDQCLEMAQFDSGKYDYVLGMFTGAFLWHVIFRLAGVKTPFIFQPCFNHVQLDQAYPMFLSSQVLLPGDIIFAGSKAASRSCARFGFRCDPLHPRGINLNTFRPLSVDKDTLRDSLNLPIKSDIALYTGRLDRDKNILELLDIVKTVREKRGLELIICYNYASEVGYILQCMRRAEKMEGVYFVRDPSLDVLIQYYNAVDLFISAAVSICETFGRSPVEAMACGTPAIVSAYDGFRDTVSDTCGALVPTKLKGSRQWPDIQGFSEAIIAMLDKKNTSLSANCIKHVQQYNNKTTLKTMLEKMNRFSVNPLSLNNPKQIRISLEGYPQEIASLFAPLEGESLYELVTDFLLTAEVPVCPIDSALEDFRKLWFSHY